MKIAFYIEDGLEQIVLTPETEVERALMDMLAAKDRDVTFGRGSFYDAKGGWKRYRPARREYYDGPDLGYLPSPRHDDDLSLIVALTPAKPAAPEALAPEAKAVVDAARAVLQDSGLNLVQRVGPTYPPWQALIDAVDVFDQINKPEHGKA